MDYGARWYDPAVGRFTGVDPLADLAPAWTPSRYGFNNPILYTDPLGLFETRAEAREHRKQEGIKGRIRKQDDGSFAIVHKGSDGNIKTFNNSEFGVITEFTYTERGVHFRDIGLDGFNELSNLYSESYNPNAVIQLDWADRAYYFGSLLGFASPSARVVTASKAAAQTVGSVDDLLRAGNVADKGNLTAVGRALQKHGSRTGSSFPKATGNPAAINEQASSILNSIVTNPNAIRTIRHHARFGNVMEVQIPGGQGARFSADGKTFINFLEP